MTKITTASNPHIPKVIEEMRINYKKNGIPTILSESLNMLLLTVSIKNPNKILEIGTATGMSGICMLNVINNAKLVTIEKEEESYLEAKANFKNFKFSDRVKQFLGDAGDILNYLDDTFDFIFLDGSKARYFDYLSDIKRLLNVGGVLFADNVLFRGFVDGSAKFGHRDNTIVRNLRAFIEDFTHDENWTTQVLNVGDGLLIARKDK